MTDASFPRKSKGATSVRPLNSDGERRLTRSTVENDDNPYWVNGEMLFRVFSSGRDSTGRLVRVRRPFALLGRSGEVDLAVDDRSVSDRHTYLHLHERGVFAVDLLTRSGTRIKGKDDMVGWLRPGDSIEVAGRRIELVRALVDDEEMTPGAIDHDMLSTNDRDPLTGLTLLPVRGGEPPWALGSEMVFLGGSASCGIPIKDSALAKVHCALFRAPEGAFLVDLCGENTEVEGRPVRGATRLHDGDRLTLGTTEFTVRVRPVSRPAPAPARNLPAIVVETGPLALDPEHLPPETQNALLAWVVGTVQGGQGEVLRRQDAFQVEVTRALRQIQQDNATLLNAHLGRIEKIDRELAALRQELERRKPGETTPAGVKPVMPTTSPLNIARPAPKEPEPVGSRTSTTWLLRRVNQLEEENRSAWKDLVSRLGPSRKDA